MFEILILAFFKLFFPSKKGSGGMGGFFILDDDIHGNEDIHDRDEEAPIMDEDFYDGPDW